MKKNYRCNYADSLECFLRIVTRGDCIHSIKHFKEISCDLPYCDKIQKDNIYCGRIGRGRKKK